MEYQMAFSGRRAINCCFCCRAYIESPNSRSCAVTKPLRILFAVLLLGAVAAQAQPYPNKPVRMVIGFPAGAFTDVMARLLAEHLSAQYGQQVVVDNKAGAASTIAAEIVSKAKPDGYTLLFGHMNSNAVAPALFPKLGYDPAKDFIAITNVAYTSLVLVVTPSLPATDVKSFIALAKSRSVPLRFASSGMGSAQHLAAESFAQQTGVKMNHIPYKGSAQAVVDLISGQVDLNFDGVGSSLQFIRAGKVRALGVATQRRVAQIPDVPTIIESGLPGFTAQSWFGVFAPAATPLDIISKLSDDINGFLKSPEIIKKVADLGGELAPPNTAGEYAKFVQNETARWAKVIRDANIKVD